MGERRQSGRRVELTPPWNAKAAKAAKKTLYFFASFAASAFDREFALQTSQRMALEPGRASAPRRARRRTGEPDRLNERAVGRHIPRGKPHPLLAGRV